MSPKPSTPALNHCATVCYVANSNIQRGQKKPTNKTKKKKEKQMTSTIFLLGLFGCFSFRFTSSHLCMFSSLVLQPSNVNTANKRLSKVTMNIQMMLVI